MENSDRKLKNKVLFYVFLLGFLMFSTLLVLSYYNYKSKMQLQFQNRTAELRSIIQTEEKRIVALYQSRLIKNLKSYGVLESIVTQDRERLYGLIKPRYEELKKENPHFNVMHFHNRDNTSLLRMHKPKKYGDDLSGIRFAVVDANRLKKEVVGFEQGRFGYFYRIITPVFSNDEHYGSVEFGLTLEYFVSNLRRLLPSTNFGLMIKKENGVQKGIKNIKDHGLIIDYDNFFSPVAEQIDLTKEYQILDIKNKSYIVSSNIYIKDYKSNDAIRVLFAIDITEFKKETINEFFYLFIIGGLTYFLSFLIINAAFTRYTASIETQSKKLQEYAKIIDEYVIISSTDLEGIITHASNSFSKVSGYSKEELIGKNHNIIRHKDMPASAFKEMWDTIEQGKVWKGEVKNRKKDGGYYWVEAHISPNYDEKENIIGYTAVRHDITDKKLIEKISQTDKLTGLNNRLKLDETLDVEISRSKRYDSSCSIIMLDIDFFKSVNDTFGHQVGDAVLQQTALILLKHSRKTDTIGRWGGEEFMVICSQTHKEGAAQLAEALRVAMESYEFDTVKSKTASFGVTEYIHGESIHQLVKRCDDALYESKKSGRNRVTVL